jgi:hypothetical protein
LYQQFLSPVQKEIYEGRYLGVVAIINL